MYDRMELWRRAISLVNTSLGNEPFPLSDYKKFEIEYSADGCKFDIVSWDPSQDAKKYAIIELTMNSESKNDQMLKYESIKPG